MSTRNNIKPVISRDSNGWFAVKTFESGIYLFRYFNNAKYFADNWTYEILGGLP